ncbi:hypothetical protein KFL_000160290 [Klebsormidium nitens]|uniref:Thioredoxin domain-containing protein n=1 Tax=Klebsormidium nitens TaxID=105231 RepID=A0A1Y1HPT6_KLENI|nr:hypothetical protein KFL_000160290 [Klebsormidium nitens]|eukprot:GAQ78626.1 hypothetical protein KFL_000160290 [Klebsormidium nitens]
MGGGDKCTPSSEDDAHDVNGGHEKQQGSKEAEELKNQGNELYQAGRVKDALSKFDEAVSKSPDVAVYRANKAAALSSLGRLGEAMLESKKAVELDDNYARAHERLANLCLRLGRFKEAKKHFEKAGEGGKDGQKRADQLDQHAKAALCARDKGEWEKALREADATIQGGADADCTLLGVKAEALQNLGRSDEAEKARAQAEKAAADAGTPAIRDPVISMLRAKIAASTGNFDGAVAAAERAVKLDPDNCAAIQTLKQVRALANARTRGNDLFKAGDFGGAEKAYSEGLETPLGKENAFLLSNRAAARSKQGHWEEALADADKATRAYPNYSKAKLRRAHAYRNLGRHEEAVRDLEELAAAAPYDADLGRELWEANRELAQSRGEDVSGWKFTPPGGLVDVTSDQQYRERVNGPGLVVGYFTATWCGPCRQIAPVIKKLPEKYPGLSIMKVDIDSHQQLAAAEGVASVPTFKVYKNGRKVNEITGANAPLLDQVISQNLQDILKKV